MGTTATQAGETTEDFGAAGLRSPATPKVHCVGARRGRVVNLDGSPCVVIDAWDTR